MSAVNQLRAAFASVQAQSQWPPWAASTAPQLRQVRERWGKKRDEVKSGERGCKECKWESVGGSGGEGMFLGGG